MCFSPTNHPCKPLTEKARDHWDSDSLLMKDDKFLQIIADGDFAYLSLYSFTRHLPFKGTGCRLAHS